MKVKVSSLCTGHGRCYVLYPDVYESDDDEGFNKFRDSEFEVSADQADEARKGVAACPERAISIEE